MATKVTTRRNGDLCVQVTVRDEENEVRVHYHPAVLDVDPLRGLLVKSAKLGTIVEEGENFGECD